MPIKGKTDLPSEIKGYPLLGRIYKGTKKRTVERNGRKVEIMGADTDHFRVEFELSKVQNPTEEQKLTLQVYQDEFRRVYGDDPRIFDDVRLYHPTPDKALDSWYKAHDSVGLVCKCDGETRRFWWDKDKRTFSRDPVPCIFAQGGECECVMVAEMPFVLMKFSLLTGIYGYFLLTTHSSGDIDNLHAAMWEVYRATNDLTQVVFTLTRRPVQKTFIDDKTHERRKVVKSLLHLFAGEQFTRRYIVPPAYRGEYAALIGSTEPPPQLTPPKPPAVQRFPEIEIESGPVIDATPIIEEADAPDTPRPTLSLKGMKLRNAFINAAKQHGISADEILDRCEVLSFDDLEWYQAAETLEIDIDPPADRKGN